jgi:hypothetical protein
VDDLSLGEVGTVLSAPLLGMLLSVAALGEGIVIGGGLAIAAGALLGVATADGSMALAS